MNPMPAYSPAPDIFDIELKAAWSRAYVGQMCQVISPMYAKKTHSDAYPSPVLYSGIRWVGDDMQLEIGQPLIYIGQTNVNCLASKGRIISKPFITVFYDGIKYLVPNPNDLKPIE